jgi:hypothetical protein
MVGIPSLAAAKWSLARDAGEAWRQSIWLSTS